MKYSNRHDAIIEYCRDKAVLDLGCLRHKEYRNDIEQSGWLHEEIREVAKYLVGIDYLKECVRDVRNLGYSVMFGDVEHLENVDLNREFDVIVAGELIEHLSNPGLFLEGVKRFMHKGSKLIITTPNPFYYPRIKLLARGKEENQWLNPEHTCWYTYQTLRQVLERHGFQEVMYGYYGRDSKRISFRSLAGKILLYLVRKNPYFMQDGLLFIAKLG